MNAITRRSPKWFPSVIAFERLRQGNGLRPGKERRGGIGLQREPTVRKAAQGKRQFEHNFRLRRDLGLRPGGGSGGIGPVEGEEAESGSTLGLAAATCSPMGGTARIGGAGEAQLGTGSPINRKNKFDLSALLPVLVSRCHRVAFGEVSLSPVLRVVRWRLWPGGRT